MKIQRAWKFKLELKEDQEKTLIRWMSHLRCLYNLALEQRIYVYVNRKLTLNYYDQAAELSILKKEYPFFAEVPSQCLQQKLKDLESAYQKFFKLGSGFPKFKKRGEGISLRFPDPKQFFVTEQKGKRKSQVKLPKIGTLEYVASQKIVGEIKNCTISLYAGNFYISFQTEYELNVPEKSKENSLGIDRGVRTLAMTSEGVELTLPTEKIQNLERKLGKAQKLLARRKKGSKNREKQKNKISKIHEKIANLRKDSLHKITSQVAKSHGLVVLENLKVKSMSRSAKGDLADPGVGVARKSGLNRSILRSSWGEFERQLSYKLSWNGGELKKVSPMFTSQTCHSCGAVNKLNRKHELFLCLSCGHKDHADINAAKNIQALGHSVTVCRGASAGVLAIAKARRAPMKQKPLGAKAP